MQMYLGQYMSLFIYDVMPMSGMYCEHEKHYRNMV